MSISFQIAEDGYDHQLPMPEAPAPEDLKDERLLRQEQLAELDGEFTYGANLGLDVSLGSGRGILYVGALYLKAAASDPSAEIDVDPLIVQVGFGFNY